MSTSHDLPEPRSTDAELIETLRLHSSLEVCELSSSLGVTATAVRQRLDRLMRAGLVERVTKAKPRGRPSHAYSLTPAGQRLGGDNFKDLALVLWREIREITDPKVRGGLLARLGAALAERCGDHVSGQAIGDRLESVAALLRDRDISCSVEREPLPVLVTRSCPYPDLAEEDRGICTAERLMLQELVGSHVELTTCRLDGEPACRFVAQESSGGACRPAG